MDAKPPLIIKLLIRIGVVIRFKTIYLSEAL